MPTEKPQNEQEIVKIENPAWLIAERIDWAEQVLAAFKEGEHQAIERAKAIVVKSRKEWFELSGGDTVDAVHQGIWNELNK